MNKNERLNTTKLSTALRQAMADMDARLSDRGESGMDQPYWPSSEQWHTARPDAGECAICLAGATFARFGIKKNETVDPRELAEEGRITEEEERMLYALDSLRVGDVTNALNSIRDEPRNAFQPEGHALDLQMQEESRMLEHDEEDAPDALTGWGDYRTMTYFDRMAAYLEEAGL